MAVPKRKTSKSRRNKRRSHHKLTAANVIEDKKDKQILIEYFSDKVLPKFNKGGPVLSGVDNYILNRYK